MMGSEIHIRPYKMHEAGKTESYFGSKSKISKNKRCSLIPFCVIQKNNIKQRQIRTPYP